jgi:hypothetical protein
MRVSTFSMVLCATTVLAQTSAPVGAPIPGAKADGVTDDTAALQRALDAAAGRTLYLPAGRYLLAGSLNLPARTVLRGEAMGLAGATGTVLLSTVGAGREDGPGCLVMQPGSAIDGLAIEYPAQGTEGEPVKYPYSITGAPSTRIQNVFLLNPYQGINLDFCHLNLVRDVWGEPLRIGISVNHCSDISRIENIHFWPYYTNAKPSLRQWVQDHGVAFQFGRSDWQYATNLFSYGYHTGFRFHTATRVEGRPGGEGGVSNGQFCGVGADRCVLGIDVENAFAIGVSFTNSLFAPFGAVEGSRAVWLRPGNTGNLTLTNCAFWAVPSSLFQVDAGSLNLSACNIQEWAVLVKDAPCFVAGGGRLSVNGCTFNRDGYLALLEGAQTRALFSGIMGKDALTMVNRIGARAVLGANSPAIQVLETPPNPTPGAPTAPGPR